MKKLLILLFIPLILISSEISDYTITEQDLNGKTIFIEHTNYKILTFSKRIADIRLSSSDLLSVTFIENKKKPLTQVKLFAKQVGKANALITFDDKSSSLINFQVLKDIRDIKLIIKNMAKDVVVSQVKKTIVLKGMVPTNKIRKKILLILKDSLSDVKVIDLLKVEEPDKMVRLKLYIAEINNDKGETIKNNWSFTGFNDGTTSFDITSAMLNAVTLSGGITAIANHIGNKFNTGLTLNYLKSNGVARILDETTLLTLENKDSSFLAGGIIMIETASTSADGQPISTITKINYGLELNIKVNEIINNKYINLEIDTSSSTLDKLNGVGLIPAKKDKSIKTNVVIENKATIVLGGLINNSNSKDWEKIPLLGDIPIIGKLFQSKDFQDGKSELVFFITPTIVDPAKSNEINKLNTMKKEIIPIKEKKVKKDTIKKQLSNQELHEQRIKKMFGI